MPAPEVLRPVAGLDDLSPVEAARGLRHLGGVAFFDSALEESAWSRLSMVAARPARVITGHIGERGNVRELEELLHSRRRVTPDSGAPIGFLGGWVEYSGKYCFGLYEEALYFDHSSGRWSEVGSLSAELRLVETGDGEFPTAAGWPPFAPVHERAEFVEMVRRAQELIGAGDIYQVNLSHPFRAPWGGDAWPLYETLRAYSPAPYGAYLELAGRSVLSASPESFLQMSGRAVRTRPIKGTRPRYAEPRADERSAFELLTSEKERAELLMITDLLRNDLGRVAEWGSVSTPELRALEKYAQVFHLVSTVEATLRPEIDHLQALLSCFPGGSITGAPKKRAREIIAELEKHPRGLYTGAIGLLGFNDESQFNIAIRTIVVEDGQAEFHAGAGIVADSTPEAEWEETLAKASGMLLGRR